MVMVYQIKDNGFLGEAKDIDPTEGVGYGWTYTEPPGDGSYKWENCAWVPAQEPVPENPAPMPPPPEIVHREWVDAPEEPALVVEQPVVEEQPIQPE